MSEKNEQAVSAQDEAQLSDENLEAVSGGFAKAPIGFISEPIGCFPTEPVVWEPIGPEIILVEGQG